MNISELCIRRPVMTVLLTAALIGAGLAAYGLLPVAALPRVDFAVISVTAQLPGASPETMASSVATPLEKQFNTIAGVNTITSVSSIGNTSITLEFNLDRNIDSAAADVQAALTQAQKNLPAEMTTAPAYRKVNPADQPILLLSLSSKTVPLSQIDDFAEHVISPRVSTLDGVAQALIFGQQKFAVRVQLDPDAMTARNISLSDVQNALAAANANTPVGTLTGPTQELTIQANRQLSDAAAFRPLIIAYRNGGAVRLGDIATVVDSVENNQIAAWHNGTRAVVLAIQRQPDANTVKVVDEVKALIPSFRADLPGNIKLDVVNDRSQSIRAAVSDVQFTLMLTIGLVVMVIFLFLRRASATLIPALAVPISLLATVGGMYLFHFSIDNISLLGLTLAVGLVVDDAIVMLENVVRYVEQGMTPFQAALKGSREIGFTIVSITLSLVSVFIPIFLMGGVVGRVFNEFAVVVAMAITVSAFVSLTLTPMLCSRFLRREHHGAEGNWFERGCEAGFNAMLAVYDRSLRWALGHRPIILGILVATIVGTGYLFSAIPKGFFPIEDTGQLYIATEANQDISYAAMAALQQKAAAIIRADRYVTSVTSAIGASGFNPSLNNGRMFVGLVPREQRPGVMAVIQELRRKVADLPGMKVFIQPIQSLQVGGKLSKSLYQYTLQGLNFDELSQWANKMKLAMSKSPLLQDVTSDLEIDSPQAQLQIDRQKAAALGVNIDQIRSSLYSAFGARQVSTIYTPSDSYEVIMELNPARQQSMSDLSHLYVRSSNGQLVPIDAFASVVQKAGPLTVNHQSQLPAVTLSFNLRPGASLGAAVNAVKAIERSEGMPPTVTSSFQGTAQVFQQALAGQGLLLLGAVIVIYIVLGVLYESFIHPITILSGLPAAAIGALLTLELFHTELTVIALIGILMLIGIVKKNGIMMIDFALAAQREQGLRPAEAIYQACILRFRPIMMTTMAAIMGTLPIAIGQGANAELRQPLGLAVVGGLILSQLLTLFITPVLFLYLDSLGRVVGRTINRGAGVTQPAGEAVHAGED